MLTSSSIRRSFQKMTSIWGEPLNLQCQYSISSLKQDNPVYVKFLKDHFLNRDDLYIAECCCPAHYHDKQPCYFTFDSICSKCKTPNRLVLSKSFFLTHLRDFMSTRYVSETSCCTHDHQSPCGYCSNCVFHDGSECELGAVEKCRFSTELTCDSSNHSVTHFTQPFHFRNDCSLIFEHLYRLKKPTLWFCEVHEHTHRSKIDGTSQEKCRIQITQCCDRAIDLAELKRSFYIIKRFPNGKDRDYLIFDPSLWREQSRNFFFSFLRSIVTTENETLINDRYQQFETSTFKCNKIQGYRSGKESFPRTNVTGFTTMGIYQTANISCELERSTCLIPQCLWKLLIDSEYFLDYICLKRDPSIKPTCMYVLRPQMNPDPNIETIIIPAAIAKPLTQDQDGDRNAAYALPKKKNGRDLTLLCTFKLAVKEMERAFNQPLTTIGTPRFSWNETDLIHVFQGSDLVRQNSLYRKLGKDPTVLLNAICGYYRDEGEQLWNDLLTINRADQNSHYLTLDDFFGETNELAKVPLSGAKGTLEHLKILKNRFNNPAGIRSQEREAECLEMCDRYVQSSRDLSDSGRNQFTLLHAANDLKTQCGLVWHNHILLVDLSQCALFCPFTFNLASLEACLMDLELAHQQNLSVNSSCIDRL